jgi:FkbM family methyltransferase
MVKIKTITPFRQIARIYSGFRQMASTIKSVHASLQHLAGIHQEIKRANDRLAGVHAAPMPNSTVALYERFGFIFALDHSSFVDRMVIERHDWEGDRISFLSGLAQRMYQGNPMVFFDLGSYWGIYSFLLSKTGFFEAIHAFDADGYNFAQLQANIFLNKMDGLISATHAAVSSENGHARMMKSRTTADGNRGASRLLIAGEELESAAVSKVAMDTLYDYAGRQLVIKMDVEGHEEEALTGMRNLIANNEIILQIEIYKEQAERVAAILDLLGLRRIGAMYPDFFYTNLPKDRLGT